MSNVKAGDLCYIVGSPERSVNGHVVTAIELVDGFSERTWQITPLHSRWWLAREKRLRPVTPRGDEVSDAEVKALFKSDTAPMVKESA